MSGKRHRSKPYIARSCRCLGRPFAEKARQQIASTSIGLMCQVCPSHSTLRERKATSSKTILHDPVDGLAAPSLKGRGVKFQAKGPIHFGCPSQRSCFAGRHCKGPTPTSKSSERCDAGSSHDCSRGRQRNLGCNEAQARGTKAAHIKLVSARVDLIDARASA